MSQATTTTETRSSSEGSDVLYRIHMVDHKDVFSKILYDVEGNILRTRMGRLINVFRANMEQAMNDGFLTVHRNSTMAGITYRYFTTSQEQMMKFIDERENGTYTGPNVRYHVYVDDDVDRDTAEFRSLFRPSREL